MVYLIGVVVDELFADADIAVVEIEGANRFHACGQRGAIRSDDIPLVLRHVVVGGRAEDSPTVAVNEVEAPAVFVGGHSGKPAGKLGRGEKFVSGEVHAVFEERQLFAVVIRGVQGCQLQLVVVCQRRLLLFAFRKGGNGIPAGAIGVFQRFYLIGVSLGGILFPLHGFDVPGIRQTVIGGIVEIQSAPVCVVVVGGRNERLAVHAVIDPVIPRAAPCQPIEKRIAGKIAGIGGDCLRVVKGEPRHSIGIDIEELVASVEEDRAHVQLQSRPLLDDIHVGDGDFAVVRRLRIDRLLYDACVLGEFLGKLVAKLHLPEPHCVGIKRIRGQAVPLVRKGAGGCDIEHVIG